ncbi:unnamed protein product [Dicrocoelium dendriticum]|nr:unnamed protein product [Dicrocoelium dendriticum]
MDSLAAPLIRKMLIGQMLPSDPNRTPVYDNTRQIWTVQTAQDRPSQLCWNLVWLQGTVVDHSQPDCFVLDDATGRVLVDYKAGENHDSLKKLRVGDYVIVIGRLMKMPTESAAPQSWQVSAKTVTLITDQFTSARSVDSQSDTTDVLGAAAAAELSWPLEVMDMSLVY